MMNDEWRMLGVRGCYFSIGDAACRRLTVIPTKAATQGIDMYSTGLALIFSQIVALEVFAIVVVAVDAECRICHD
jgi:hypothetical protein